MIYHVDRKPENAKVLTERKTFQTFNKEEIVKEFHAMIERGEDGDIIEYSSQDETGWYPNIFEVEIIDKKPMIKTKKHGSHKKYIPYNYDTKNIKNLAVSQ